MKPPAYLDAIMRLFESGAIKPGSVAQVDVAHDPRCALLHGLLRCDCQPLVTVRRDAA